MVVWGQFYGRFRAQMRGIIVLREAEKASN